MKNKRSLNKLGDNNRITSGRTSETEIDTTEYVSTMAYKIHRKHHGGTFEQ